MKILKIQNPDLNKYKLQKNVRRRYQGQNLTYEQLIAATDEDS